MDIRTDPNTQPELIAALQQVHQAVAATFARIPAEEFFQNSAEGWSPAENLVHLIKSVSPVGKAMNLPKLVSSTVFGTSQSGSMRFAELRDRYLARLAEGAQATGPYVPEVEAAPADVEQAKQTMLAKWQEVSARLLDALHHWSESDLDKYTLPHPLMGKITVREMLFFTLFHDLLHANEARAFLNEPALTI